MMKPKTKRKDKGEESIEGADGAPIEGHAAALEGETEGDLISELQEQVADLDSRYKRALADYQNFQRRAIENERRSREAGMASVVESLIPLLDHFKLALDQDTSKASAEQVLGGVKVIHEEFVRTLGAFGVTTIEPAPQDEFDPMRHQAMMMVESEDVEPGHVVMLLQAGYALGERVVRPAKVSVRPADEVGEADASAGADTDPEQPEG